MILYPCISTPPKSYSNSEISGIVAMDTMWDITANFDANSILPPCLCVKITIVTADGRDSIVTMMFTRNAGALSALSMINVRIGETINLIKQP